MPQLVEFLKTPVERFGGMMPLPDVYCLFNRARGTELVSPDDLLAAVKLFPTIGAPFQVRRQLGQWLYRWLGLTVRDGSVASTVECCL